MTKRVFLYVQHLLGIGHLKRAATLADAMTRAGHEVTLASGGEPVPGLRINAARVVQLPPASAADTGFKVLLDATGQPIDEAWKARRRECLLAAWRAADAHALIVELYPFGRRRMRFELIPLLEAARAGRHAPGDARPVIACSVRDVLGGSRDAARQEAQLEVFDRYFDHLLVHGDRALIPFERTFGPAARLGARLHYTGYVVDVAPAAPAVAPEVPGADITATDVPASGAPASDAGRDEVIVSAGGGAVGARLMEMALRARPLSGLASRTWRLLTGVNIDPADFAALRALAERVGEGRVIVERSRADFTQLLANCALSISQGGYNTMMETLHACARSVVVPFAAGAETEQTLRAELLQQRGLLVLVAEAALTPETLAAAVDRAMQLARPARSPVDLDGAQRSAQLLCEWTRELSW
jgi:predicted glycosyltransferase